MKLLLWLIGIAGALYVLVCLLLYWQQERLLFFPTKLPADYRFRFPGRWQERWITAPDGTRLNGLLFRAEGPRRCTATVAPSTAGGRWPRFTPRWATTCSCSTTAATAKARAASAARSS